MQILIMRHGEAELYAASDAQRQLTPAGRSQCGQIADWLQGQHINIDHLLVSPYTRALQTLSVLRERLSLPEKARVQPELTPGGDARYISEQLHLLADDGAGAVLIISHLPLVGYLVAKLCPQQPPPMFATAQIISITLSPHTEHGIINWQQTANKLNETN